MRCSLAIDREQGCGPSQKCQLVLTDTFFWTHFFLTNIDAFYVLQGHYIDATREEILKTYGSADNYLRKGLKLSDAEIQALRDSLLE